MSETDLASVHPSDVEIEVWQVHPHLDSSFDCAIIDDYARAIDYAKGVVESVFDKLSVGDEVQITIKLTKMTRGDFDADAGE